VTPPRVLYVAEPPALYLARKPLVVDSSLLCAILFSEPERPMAEARVMGHALHAPLLLDHEIANVTLVKQRKGLTNELTQLAMQDYLNHQIELHPVDLRGHFALGQRYGLSAYDAAYLWLAVELDAPLATFDRKLNDAAQAHFNDAR
jgi:predicted nucleic acid-binding protein